MAERFIMIKQDASESEIYSFISMLHEKANSLSKDLEGLEKKKAREIELGLKVLVKYFKSKV